MVLVLHPKFSCQVIDNCFFNVYIFLSSLALTLYYLCGQSCPESHITFKVWFSGNYKVLTSVTSFSSPS